MADRICGDQRFILSRRTTLAGLAATCAAGLAGPIAESQAAENSSGPVFSPSGPNAEFYGAAESYPVRDPALGFVWDPCNVLYVPEATGAPTLEYAALAPRIFHIHVKDAVRAQREAAPVGLGDVGWREHFQAIARCESALPLALGA